MPAVGGHHELGSHIQAPLGRGDLDAGDAAGLLEEADDLGAHSQAEARIAGSSLREEVQEIPLRQERDELAARRQMREVRDRHGHLADLHDELMHLLMRQLQEVFEQSELVQDLERGRVDRVAAKVAQEVGVLLEHENLDAGPGEEEPEHHPGRPSTGDAAGRRERGHGSGRRRPPRCSRAHAE